MLAGGLVAAPAWTHWHHAWTPREQARQL
jgi:hypothetical protein